MVFQFSALETLLPPNFMTTHGDSDISAGAPRFSPDSKRASEIIDYPTLLGQKKTREEFLAGR